jgi:multidrug efflux pump subunit AcrB
LRAVPGAVDLRIQQTFDYPKLQVDVDRTKAQELGLTQQDVASNMLVSLSGSFQTSPSFWFDPKSGTEYNVVAQTPEPFLDSINRLQTTPLTAGTAAGAHAQMLANVATIHREVAAEVVSHYDARTVLDIYGTAQGTDLGFIASQINRILDETHKDVPRGSQVTVRGQVKTMTESFNGLLLGLLGAVVLVYLLIVVNFQSWLDPFIILTALPGALAGILWMLFVTGTTLSVPSLMGSIMCIGVATANSILMVTFANDQRESAISARDAMLSAGHARIRPVLMTAAAMILGMLPMALGLGEGGEQNAPLGRAVIGGLLFATVTTLFVVPIIYSYLRTKPPVDHESQLQHLGL